MQLLGAIEKISASGKLIVRASGKLNLRIGQKVFLNKRPIGRIYDVIGPVSKPWVLIDVENPDGLVGKKVYLG
uniref:H/ACA RNA-protein complex protein Gar1 n=1 Tax=uncultured euryarchaeote Alv-FOS5 TaxID=337891 RepID=Q3SBA7_9EURY|nr:hypothetical protein [uncultured euryarchaeote Alv-FOS5]